jgi:hypothetical protein
MSDIRFSSLPNSASAAPERHLRKASIPVPFGWQSLDRRPGQTGATEG